MFDILNYELSFSNKHIYSLAFISSDRSVRSVQKTFISRDQANKYMYKLCDKLHLTVNKIYDDHHDKTYICDDNSTFYIHRSY